VLGNGPDVVDLALDVMVRAANAGQDLAGGGDPIVGDQPDRTLGLAQHAHEEQDGRNRGQTEHEPPVSARAQAVVHQECGKNSRGEGQLIEAHQRTSNTRRCHLADVERHRHGRRADRQSDHEPHDDQEPEGRREGRCQHAEHEDAGGDEDDRTPADHVGQFPRAERAHRRADQQQAGDQLLV
jgi:hypothetical protein